MSTGFKPVDFRHDDALTRVSWDEFERLIAEYYRGQGFAVDHVGTGANGRRTDGGIDMILRQGLETIVVQCKHWNCWKVPHNDVHQLIGVMHTAAATGAIVISSGEFTNAAIEAAAKFRHIRLIDGKAVRALLGPVDEPEMPHATLDTMPSWMTNARRRTAAATRSPALAITGAFLTMLLALGVLYIYYVASFQKAQLDVIRAATAQATRQVAAVAATPAAPFIRAVQKPVSASLNDHPVIVHDAPATKAEIAAWEAKNAESMRILEKTTPSVP